MEMHVVRSGETLSRIAHCHGTTWQVIARLNALKHPAELTVGQRLKLPTALRKSFHGSDGSTARNHDLVQTSAPRSGACFPGDITERELRVIMPHSIARSAFFVGSLNVAMRAYGIDVIEKKAAFLG